MTRQDDDVCLQHSGVCENMKFSRENIGDLWKAIGQIRAMFAVTMLSTIGTLLSVLWIIVSKKIGL